MPGASSGGYLPPIVATFLANATDVEGKIVEIKAQLEDLSKTPTEVTIDLNEGPLAAGLMTATGQLDLFEHSFGQMQLNLGLDFAEMEAALAAARAAAAGGVTMPLTIDPAAALAEIAAIKAALLAANGGGRVSIGGGVTLPVGGGGDSGGGGGGAGAILTMTTLNKLLGIGAGAATHFGITMAGAFSIGSLAGLGFEHVLTTALGLAGSLAGAIGGGLLLALGAAGVAAVGMGSDMLVMKSTIADTKSLSQALNNVSQAVAVYGANSYQAAAATGQLNYLIKSLGNTAGVQAELGLAKATQALNAFWDQATSTARVAAVGFIQPFLSIAYTYIPLVASSATRNFGIMTQAFKPLIAYLNGPGTTVFRNLENIFAQNLPTAIHAFTMGIELLFKTLNFLAPLTGGITRALDHLLTTANSPSGFATWAGWMTTLIGLFHTWWNFFIIFAKDVVDFFRLTAGVGSAIVVALTGMLTQLHQWLALTTTQTTLSNLFTIHKQQIMDLLALIPPLVSSLGHVYLSVAPALAGALVMVLSALAPILTAITSNAWGAWAVGLAIIAQKFGMLMPAVGALAAKLAVTVLGWFGYTTASAAAAAATQAQADAVARLVALQTAQALGADAAAASTGALAASEVGATAATDAMGSTGLKTFSLMALATNPITLGIAAVGAAALVVALNWKGIAAGFSSQADQIKTAVQGVDTAWNGMLSQSAASAVQLISTNLLGFQSALQQTKITLDGGITPAINQFGGAVTTAEVAVLHNNATIAQTSTVVASASYRVANYAGALKSAAVVSNAAATESYNKNMALWSSLQALQSGYGNLAKPVQAFINETLQAKDGGAAAAATYQLLQNVQVASLPVFTSSAGKLTGVANASDTVTAALVRGIAQGGAMAKVYAGLLQQWQQSGSENGYLAQTMLAGLPAWQAMYNQVYNEGIAQGLSAKAAAAHAAVLANQLDPAGAAMNTTIGLMTAAYNALHPQQQITLADMALLIQSNPSLVQAFLNQQQAINNTAAAYNGMSIAAVNAANTIITNDARALASARALAIQSHTLSGSFSSYATGGIAEAPTTGGLAMLHGKEFIVPASKASPELQSLMVNAIAGGKPPGNAVRSPGAMNFTVAGASGGGAGGGAGGGISVALGSITVNVPPGTPSQVATQVGTLTQQAVNNGIFQAIRQMRGGAKTYGFMPG